MRSLDRPLEVTTGQTGAPREPRIRETDHPAETFPRLCGVAPQSAAVHQLTGRTEARHRGRPKLEGTGTRGPPVPPVDATSRTTEAPAAPTRVRDIPEHLARTGQGLGEAPEVSTAIVLHEPKVHGASRDRVLMERVLMDRVLMDRVRIATEPATLARTVRVLRLQVRASAERLVRVRTKPAQGVHGPANVAATPVAAANVVVDGPALIVGAKVVVANAEAAGR